MVERTSFVFVCSSKKPSDECGNLSLSVFFFFSNISFCSLICWSDYVFKYNVVYNLYVISIILSFCD